MDTCETCRFAQINWRKGDEHDVLVEYRTTEIQKRVSTSIQCRRHAPRGPVVVPGNCYEVMAFPWLDGSDWCGEHQPKAPTS